MDIEYLLVLQNLRESTHDFFSPFLMWISDYMIGFWPIAIVCMIYWVWDRKAGRTIFFGFGLGNLINGALKMSFQVARPWLRDARVLPYGNSKVTATGFSFPSGHATYATSLTGGVAVWLGKLRKEAKLSGNRTRSRLHTILFIILIAAVLILMFSRNYLGVHTPQDVLIGFISTLVMMLLAKWVEDWTEKDPKRDIPVMIAGLIVCGAALLFYSTIHIEPVFNEEGVMIVNPVKIVADAYQGIGFVSAYVICRYFSKRHFITKQSRKERFILGVFALIPLYLWCRYFFPVIAPVNRKLAYFLLHGGIVVYTMIIAPWIMSKIHLSKTADETGESSTKKA